jgi:hypothetical protein
MGKLFLKYTGGLIALYVVVYNGSRSGQVITSGANGYSRAVRTLQGR